MPKLAIETYPINYDDNPTIARPQLPAQHPMSVEGVPLGHLPTFNPKAPPPLPKSETEDESWGQWIAAKKEDAPTTVAGDHPGELPAMDVDASTDPAPDSWMQMHQNVWNAFVGQVELDELEVGFVSRPDLLGEEAETKFNEATIAPFEKRG